jgi:hypothetical protein
MSADSKTRNLDWLRADYLRTQGHPFEHFYCPMLMKDEPTDLMLGHVANVKFEDVPEYKLVQRKDIDGWYGSMFEADFLNLVRFQNKQITDLFFWGKPRRRKKNDHKTPPMLKPLIKAGEQEIPYYYLSDKLDELPVNEHTLLEMNSQNGDFLRLALKKTPDEVRALQHVKWHSEIFGDFRVAVLVSCIKAAYLTLFWKLGYGYTLSAAGMSVGREILGRFFLENHGKDKEAIQVAAVEFFRPYINMLRPVQIAGDEAPKGTIEDNRVFIWLGSSRRGLGIGVFIRANKRLQCVLMPATQFPPRISRGVWVYTSTSRSAARRPLNDLNRESGLVLARK